MDVPVPAGGSDGQVLGRAGGDLTWVDQTADTNTEYTAGSGLTLTGTRFSVTLPVPSGAAQGQILSQGGSGLEWVAPTDTDTTYTAGSGLTLDAGVFSVDRPVPSIGSDGQVLGISGGSIAWIDQTADTDTTYAAGTGLTLDGTTFNVDLPLPSGGSDGQVLGRSGGAAAWVTPADTDTTYTAGSGLTLTATEFAVERPVPGGGTENQVLARVGTGIEWVSGSRITSAWTTIADFNIVDFDPSTNKEMPNETMDDQGNFVNSRITIPASGRIKITVDNAKVRGEAELAASVLRKELRDTSAAMWVKADHRYSDEAGLRFYTDTDNHLWCWNGVDAESVQNCRVIIEHMNDGFLPEPAS